MLHTRLLAGGRIGNCTPHLSPRFPAPDRRQLPLRKSGAPAPCRARNRPQLPLLSQSSSLPTHLFHNLPLYLR